MGQRIMTLRQGHREGTEILGKAGIAEASLDSWLLLRIMGNRTGYLRKKRQTDMRH